MKKLMILVAVLLLAGCKGYYEQPQPTGPLPAPETTPTLRTEQIENSQMPAQSSTVDVAIQGFSFNPGTITIKAGDTVVWMQQDGVPHTATATSGPEMFDSGRLSKGQSFSQTFDTPGTYEYQCNIHPSMRGTVIVS